MLELKNIIKKYKSGNEFVDALKGVNISFRENEFVAILGPSGCGKTTLLNIIGGLDKYSTGDLIINDVSTKKYKDSDWDVYRNHSVGFVFQSYNLIPHQTVLSNVELALTLSGVGAKERRQLAIDALHLVGLGDQLHKKPNQMSGGQMQRVAIARALVNNPDILLADEPTGALDSKTSVQIMDILKDIAKDRLVIMVTHNPELAVQYATRTVRLLDGKIIDDTNPFDPTAVEEVATSNQTEGDSKEEATVKVADTTNEVTETSNSETKNKKAKGLKKKNMSLATALGLSLNNLLTKKTRTLLTAFAGSIGIIGIALILSVSSGVQNYIDTVQESTMASYPLEITETTMDMSSMITITTTSKENLPGEGEFGPTNVGIAGLDMLSTMIKKNNLSSFKEYIEKNKEEFNKYSTDIVYTYDTVVNAYRKTTDGTDTVYEKTFNTTDEITEYIGAQAPQTPMQQFGVGAQTNEFWKQFVGDQNYISSQYNLVYGSYPTNSNQVVLSLDANNQVSDVVLYALGLLDIEDLKAYNEALKAHNEDPENNPKPEVPTYPHFKYEEILNYKYKVLLESDKYKVDEANNKIVKKTDAEVEEAIKNSKFDVEIVGIVKPTENSVNQSTSGCLIYSKDFMDRMIHDNNNSAVVKYQQENTETDLQTGLAFITRYTMENYADVFEYLASSGYLMFLPMLGYDVNKEAEIIRYANDYLTNTHKDALERLGYVDESSPSGISIYPRDFDSKEQISTLITKYNETQSKENQITYTDMVGLMLSSVTVIVNAISYVLIAFVSISLVVSSIMIGIITYISVLERTKEIGILRAIGASKKDVSRVFNAETLIIGLSSGVMGILITLILIIPINLILHSATNISYLSASLPFVASIVLILISMFLTFIAGLIPAHIAAKKDPVIALRTE